MVTGGRGTVIAGHLRRRPHVRVDSKVAADWDALVGHRSVSEGDAIRDAIQRTEPLPTEYETFADAVSCHPAGTVTVVRGSVPVRTASAVFESARTVVLVNLKPPGVAF